MFNFIIMFKNIELSIMVEHYPALGETSSHNASKHISTVKKSLTATSVIPLKTDRTSAEVQIQKLKIDSDYWIDNARQISCKWHAVLDMA